MPDLDDLIESMAAESRVRKAAANQSLAKGLAEHSEPPVLAHFAFVVLHQLMSKAAVKLTKEGVTTSFLRNGNTITMMGGPAVSNAAHELGKSTVSVGVSGQRSVDWTPPQDSAALHQQATEFVTQMCLAACR